LIILLLTGLALTALSVVLLARSVAFSRTRTLETMETIGAYGFAVRELEEDPPGALRATINEVAVLLGEALAGRMGAIKEAELRRALIAAGLYGVSPRRFLGYQGMAAVGLPLLWIYLGLTMGVSALVLVLSTFFAVALGWILPLVWIHRSARLRREQVEYDLPELIDLLVVTVEAGLGFTGSLQLASQRIPGPLGQELRLAVQEQNMGLSTSEALKNMLIRCDTPSVRTFVRAVTQGETLGVSIGTILRNLAMEMRKRRRAAAEERAQKAPVKILFPLILLIFPAMYVVILFPAMYDLLTQLG
jgi:tight adherence protein C